VGVEVGSRETSSSRETCPPTPGSSLHPGTDAPSLVALLEMALDPEAWEAFSRGSAIRRAGRAGFARNVCVAIGNWGSPGALPVLSRALADPEPLVRGHAAWALGRVGGAAAREALSGAASSKQDAWVSAELEDATSKAG
jgi:epoxyqueuosine reductase